MYKDIRVNRKLSVDTTWHTVKRPSRPVNRFLRVKEDLLGSFREE
jgi:hypothetical protein